LVAGSTIRVECAFGQQGRIGNTDPVEALVLCIGAVVLRDATSFVAHRVHADLASLTVRIEVTGVSRVRLVPAEVSVTSLPRAALVDGRARRMACSVDADALPVEALLVKLAGTGGAGPVGAEPVDAGLTRAAFRRALAGRAWRRNAGATIVAEPKTGNGAVRVGRAGHRGLAGTVLTAEESSVAIRIGRTGLGGLGHAGATIVANREVGIRAIVVRQAGVTRDAGAAIIAQISRRAVIVRRAGVGGLTLTTVRLTVLTGCTVTIRLTTGFGPVRRADTSLRLGTVPIQRTIIVRHTGFSAVTQILRVVIAIGILRAVGISLTIQVDVLAISVSNILFLRTGLPRATPDHATARVGIPASIVTITIEPTATERCSRCCCQYQSGKRFHHPTSSSFEHHAIRCSFGVLRIRQWVSMQRPYQKLAHPNLQRPILTRGPKRLTQARSAKEAGPSDPPSSSRNVYVPSGQL